jgi:L-2,4-diaminobutyric acid acetyltransferase
VDLVRNCEPFLTAHRSYIYWMNIQYFRETCAVAERNGEIVGWCSMVRVSSAKYFLHQLGVAPKARRQGIAASLFVYLLRRLRQRHAWFEIEFTSDRRNRAVLELNRLIVERMGMRLMKKPDVVQVIEDSEEELYTMTSTAPKEDDEAFNHRQSAHFRGIGAVAHIG